jgi:hypothetical protein
LATAGAVGLSAVLIACTATGGGTGADATSGAGPSEPATDGSTGPTSAGSPGLGELAAVFGGQVSPQEEGAFGLEQWSLVDGAPPGVDGPVLRVAYPAGSVSPSATREFGSPEGGMQVFLPFTTGPVEEAHLRYWVRFPAGFEFVKGGKLPGLYGGTEVSGGEEPDGTDGFSTRLMWRTDGDGEVYLYAPGESGTSLGRGDWTWQRDVWLCVEQQVVLDRPDAEDGSVTVWVDGEQVFSDDGMEYRTVADLRIDGIFFSTFYGGADPSWAPSEDQHADFAGFAVSAERMGCG